MGFGDNSDDFFDEWQRQANEESSSPYPDGPCGFEGWCKSQDFQNIEGKWCCNECGNPYRYEVLDDFSDYDKDVEDDEVGEDCTEDEGWKNSEFYVPRAKKTGRIGKNTNLISPFIATMMKARSLLNMNKRTKSNNRSPLFFPFYTSSEGRGMFAEDIIKSTTTLPGPFIDLLYNDHLPPRRWWHKTNLGGDGLPIGPSDWIPHYHRLGFELFIHLHAVHNRPWSLYMWAKKIRIGTRLLEILEKGGPLGRVGGQYLRDFNHRGLMKSDIVGFIENLRSLNIITSFQDQNNITDEAWNLLQRMRDTPSKESTVFDRFIEKNCMLSANDEPTQFWCMNNKLRTEVGTFCVQSIPIAFAVAEAAKRIENIPYESIVNIGNSEIYVVNTKDIDRLSAWWRWCIKQIGETSVIS